MSAVTPPEKVAESAVLVNGGYDPCQYEVVNDLQQVLPSKLKNYFEQTSATNRPTPAKECNDGYELLVGQIMLKSRIITVN